MLKLYGLFGSLVLLVYTAPGCRGLLTPNSKTLTDSDRVVQGAVRGYSKDEWQLAIASEDLFVKANLVSKEIQQVLQEGQANPNKLVNVTLPEGSYRSKPLDLGVRPDCSELPLDYTTLLDLANESSSINDLVSKIPLGTMQNFTLMHTSRAPMAADVSAQWPRVIRFNKDSTLMMAYTCDPTKPSYDHVEFIAFDKSKNVFEMADAHLKLPAGPNKIEKNPEACMSCHSPTPGKKDPRPIWEMYSSWPGAYGSEDDTFSKHDISTRDVISTPFSDAKKSEIEKEKKNFLAFKKRVISGSDPCYSSLPWLNPPDEGALSRVTAKIKNRSLSWSQNLDLYPYSDLHKSREFYEVRPNLKITEMGARLLARRIVGKMKSHKSWERFKYLLYMSALVNHPQHTTAASCQMPSAYQTDLAQILPGFGLVPDPGPRSQATARSPETAMQGTRFDPRSNVSRARLIYSVAKAVGIQPADWHLKFDREINPIYLSAIKPDFSMYPKSLYPSQDSIQDLSVGDLVRGELLKELRNDFGQLADLLYSGQGSKGWFGERFACIDDSATEVYLSKTARQQDFNWICSNLSTFWTKYKNDVSRDREATEQDDSYKNRDLGAVEYELAKAGKDVVESECRYCHSSEGELAKRLRFFENGESLYQVTPTSEFYDKVMERLNSSHRQMPPPPADALSDIARTQVLEYIKTRGMLEQYAPGAPVAAAAGGGSSFEAPVLSPRPH